MKNIVRLSSLTLKNIKNVKNGTIIMPLANERKFECSKAEILGIYGQNGSGKTAIVDALYFLQIIMTGKEIDQRLTDYIDTDSINAEINAEFEIFGDEVLYEVGYHILFLKTDDDIVIEREYLNCAVNENGYRTNKNIFMDYQRAQTDFVFKPVKRLEELVGKDKNLKMDLIVARKMSEKSNCSYVFGKDSRDIFLKENSKFKNYSIVIRALFNFALKDLFVIRSAHSGVISANFLLPMAFRIEKEKKGMRGDFAVPLMEPVILDIKKKKLRKVWLLGLLLIIQYNYNNLFNNSFVTMMDVSQGDSIVVHVNNNTTLIDTGGNISYSYSDNIINYLKSQGIRKIDNLILSHGDYDHMGDAINIIENFKVDKVIFNCGEFNDLEKELIKVLDKKKIKYYSRIKEL